MKRCQTASTIRKTKENPKRYLYNHIRMTEIKFQNKQCGLAMMRSLWNFKTWLVGVQNGSATLENNLVVSYKAKHTLTIWPSSPTTQNLPKRNETLYLYQTCKHHIYSRWFITSKNWKQSSVFDRWLHLYDRIILSNKKDTTIDRSRNMDGPQIHSAVQKRLDSRRATSCTVAFTQHLGQRKTIGTENRWEAAQDWPRRVD